MAHPIVLRPHGPFDFVAKWSNPVWKKCGLYIWSIEHQGAYLVSYVGQVFGTSRNFDKRIWEEYKWWKQGRDRPVEIEEYKAGRRREIATFTQDHLTRELAQITPILRWWLMPLDTKAECDQAERWLVAELCRDSVSRQFLANCNPLGYHPDPQWSVHVEAPETFRVVGLTIPR